MYDSNGLVGSILPGEAVEGVTLGLSNAIKMPVNHGLSSRLFKSYGFVLLDLDGTLIDQSKVIYRCCMKALSIVGERPPTYLAFQHVFGSSPEVWMRRFASAGLANDAVAHYQRLLAACGTRGVRLLAGCREFLEECRRHGVKLALITNKSGFVTRQIIQDYGLGAYFQIALGLGDTPWRKPEPELVSAALHMMDARPGNCLVVGDSPVDIRMAKLSGLDSLGVASGAHAVRELERAGATYVVHSLSKVLAAP